MLFHTAHKLQVGLLFGVAFIILEGRRQHLWHGRASLRRVAVAIMKKIDSVLGKSHCLGIKGVGEPMTPVERSEVREICKRIAEEQDPVEFQRLVVELFDVLDRVTPGEVESKPN